MVQKFKVQVETEAEYEVELSDNFFYGLTEKQWLENFSQHFFKVQDMEDIIKHITLFYSQNGNGFLEGVGEVSDWAEGAMATVQEVYRDNVFTTKKE